MQPLIEITPFTTTRQLKAILDSRCKNHVSPKHDPDNNLHNHIHRYVGPDAYYDIHCEDWDLKLYFLNVKYGKLVILYGGKNHHFCDIKSIRFVVHFDDQAVVHVVWNAPHPYNLSLMEYERAVTGQLHGMLFGDFDPKDLIAFLTQKGLNKPEVGERFAVTTIRVADVNESKQEGCVEELTAQLTEMINPDTNARNEMSPADRATLLHQWPNKEISDTVRKINNAFGLSFEMASNLAATASAKVARKGWNGLNMWVIHTPSRVITDVEPNSFYDRMNAVPPVHISGHFDLHSSDGTMIIGWLPTYTDLMTKDWYVVE